MIKIALKAVLEKPRAAQIILRTNSILAHIGDRRTERPSTAYADRRTGDTHRRRQTGGHADTDVSTLTGTQQADTDTCT